MKKLAALAALCAVAVPSQPASATHELAAACAFVVDASTQAACYQLLNVGIVVGCSAVVMEDTPDSDLVVFYGGLAYFAQAASIRSVCYKGGAWAELTTEGKIGGVGAAVRSHQNTDGPVCSRWDVRFEPGNTYGYDPNQTYVYDGYCV